jgi:flavin-dependent dehydrogenase
MYDAVIVGAGPAGSAAARRLSEAGLKSVVLEREPLGRDKPCAGGRPDRHLLHAPEDCAEHG